MSNIVFNPYTPLLGYGGEITSQEGGSQKVIIFQSEVISQALFGVGRNAPVRCAQWNAEWATVKFWKKRWGQWAEQMLFPKYLF